MLHFWAPSSDETPESLDTKHVLQGVPDVGAFVNFS